MTSLRSLVAAAALAALAALAAAPLSAAGDAAPAAEKALPRLVDLGASKCIPCKQMKPILDDLAHNYAAKFETIFIDVWENRAEGQRYRIRMIPTQIFFDAAGKELFRHEGFMAKKDILATWERFGIDVALPAPAAAPKS